MKIESGFKALGVLLMTLVLAGIPAGSAQAATGAAAPGGALTLAEGQAAADPVPPIRPMTDGEKQAAGCILSSTATMAATYAAGPSEVIMLVVGGLIVPSSSEVLFIGLMGTMASMACGAGAAITPAVLWAVKQSGQIGQQASAVTDRVGSGLAQIGSGVSHALASFSGQAAQFAEAPEPAR